MPYQRLSAQDTVFLRIEDAHQPQHVGSLSLYEGGSWRDEAGRLRIEDLRAHVAGRIHRVPRLRQRLMFVPFGQGRPVWVDDDRFDLDYHVRLTALPRPGDEAQLLELMGRVQSLPLDRARPLWELWFVDGIEGDRVGLIIKTHHALGDGIANVDLGMALVDLTPEVVDEPDPAPWRPEPAPSPVGLWRDSVTEQLTRPFALVGGVLRAVRDPGPAVAAVASVAQTLWTFAAQPAPAPWNTPVTQHRRWSPARVSMDEARAIKAQAGCSLNDVVVAACTLALRRFLTEHGDGVEGRTLKAMVPVSTRRQDEHGTTLGNRVSMFVVDLPVDESDPVRVLEKVHLQTAVLKGSTIVDGAESVIQLADGITPLAAPLTRFVSRHIPMNLVITNVPGPPVPLYLRGARLLEVFPYVEVVDNEGLTMAVLSYAGQLEFGVTSDRDVIPDLGRLTEQVEKAFGELRDAVGGAVEGRREDAGNGPDRSQ
ncbi:MAG: wax ester/triacylglycerol synthase family O-acyltransferase [Acidimicrobiales bacterium]|jgi:WS/DGAT/MGAT family acyltransferase|nr:wax ester/triacylglycerol synthase family O-acyltransferase [Acidimicrobiales bacterium]